DAGLSGKVAIVTGAGRVGGIGEAIAHALAREKAKIVLSDIGRALEQFPDYQVAGRTEIEKIRVDLRGLGAEAEIVFADVSKEVGSSTSRARRERRDGRYSARTARPNSRSSDSPRSRRKSSVSTRSRSTPSAPVRSRPRSSVCAAASGKRIRSFPARRSTS